MKEFLPAVERSIGSGQPDAAVIWLHGLGADGHDFAPVVEQLQLPANLSVRFVLPHAPVKPVTLNGGYEMPSWFDLYSLESFGRLDLPGLRTSAAAIDALMDREIERGIRPARLLLAGFSQGGALALYAGLRYPERLAGVIALSTFLPFNPVVDADRNPANNGLPVFLAHGLWDPTVNYAFALQTRTWLSGLGYGVEFHDYQMAHAVCPQEIEDIRAWMIRTLA